jgi:hypothetical protein
MAGYTAGSETLRTPNRDDVEGICAIYPPGRRASISSCEPRHGFSESCADDQPATMEAEAEPEETADAGSESSGCSLSARREREASSLLGALATLLFVLRRRSSSPKSHQLVPCERRGLRG